jgi:hypothetical protein
VEGTNSSIVLTVAGGPMAFGDLFPICLWFSMGRSAK